MAPGPDGNLIRSKGEAPSKQHGWTYWLPDGSREMLTVCPLPKVPKWWDQITGELHRYRKGILIRDGGSARQPRAYLRVMEYLSACLEHFQAKKQAREAGRPAWVNPKR